MLKFAFLICLLSTGFALSANFLEIKPFEKQEVMLVLAPHPDDETLGCAGIIQEALSKGCSVYIVFFTNGDHNEIAFKLYEKKIILTPEGYIKMGEVRRKEAIAATEILGVPKENLIFLGYPDYGTSKIWEQHWQNAPSFKNFLTRANNVPYPENYSYKAPYKGESILNDLESIFLKLCPDRIFVSHSADTNVDHRALYNFTKVALLDLEGKIPAPEVYPYLIHSGRWPYPYHYHPELALTPPDKLVNEIIWENYNLDASQIQKKLTALDCYKSQKVDRGYWMVSFVKKNEIFGDFKVINLIEPQLDGRRTYFSGLTDGDLPPEVIEQKSKIDKFYLLKEKDRLLLWVNFDRELEKELGFAIYVFGYSRKIPFPRMPKISIKFVPPDRIVLRDGMSIIFNNDMIVKKSSREVFLQVPLELLENPDFVFLSMELCMGEFPVDLTPWRIIKIK